MNRRQSVAFVAAATIASGLAVVLLARSESTRSMQQAMSGQMHARMKRIGGCLGEVKDHLNRIETQLEHTSAEFVQRISEVGQGVVTRYLPDDPLAGREWDLQGSDIAHDLPRMPRS